jgi:hypothetical protein
MWMGRHDQAFGRMTTAPPEVVHGGTRGLAAWSTKQSHPVYGTQGDFACYGSLNALAKDDFLTFSET